MNQKMLKPHRTAPAAVTEEMLQRVREGKRVTLRSGNPPPNQCRVLSGRLYLTSGSELATSPLRSRLGSPQAQGHLNVVSASDDP